MAVTGGALAAPSATGTVVWRYAAPSSWAPLHASQDAVPQKSPVAVRPGRVSRQPSPGPALRPCWQSPRTARTPQCTPPQQEGARAVLGPGISPNPNTLSMETLRPSSEGPPTPQDSRQVRRGRAQVPGEALDLQALLAQIDAQCQREAPSKSLSRATSRASSARSVAWDDQATEAGSDRRVSWDGFKQAGKAAEALIHELWAPTTHDIASAFPLLTTAPAPSASGPLSGTGSTLKGGEIETTTPSRSTVADLVKQAQRVGQSQPQTPSRGNCPGRVSEQPVRPGGETPLPVVLDLVPSPVGTPRQPLEPRFMQRPSAATRVEGVQQGSKHLQQLPWIGNTASDKTAAVLAAEPGRQDGIAFALPQAKGSGNAAQPLSVSALVEAAQHGARQMRESNWIESRAGESKPRRAKSSESDPAEGPAPQPERQRPSVTAPAEAAQQGAQQTRGSNVVEIMARESDLRRAKLLDACSVKGGALKPRSVQEGLSPGVTQLELGTLRVTSAVREAASWKTAGEPFAPAPPDLKTVAGLLAARPQGAVGAVWEAESVGAQRRMAEDVGPSADAAAGAGRFAASALQAETPSRIFQRPPSQAQLMQLESSLVLQWRDRLRALVKEQFNWALSLPSNAGPAPDSINHTGVITAAQQLAYLCGLPSLDKAATLALFGRYSVQGGKDHPCWTLDDFQAAYLELLEAALAGYNGQPQRPDAGPGNAMAARTKCGLLRD